MAGKSSGVPVTFTENGRRCVLSDVHYLEAADSFLANDLMFVRIDHRGRHRFRPHCARRAVLPAARTHTTYSQCFRCCLRPRRGDGRVLERAVRPCPEGAGGFEFAPGVTRHHLAKRHERHRARRCASSSRRTKPSSLWTFAVRNVSAPPPSLALSVLPHRGFSPTSGTYAGSTRSSAASSTSTSPTTSRSRTTTGTRASRTASSASRTASPLRMRPTWTSSRDAPAMRPEATPAADAFQGLCQLRKRLRRVPVHLDARAGQVRGGQRRLRPRQGPWPRCFA